VLALLVVAAVALRWPQASAGPDYAVPAAELATARAQLDGLEVRGRAPLTGYERAEFGDGWADLDADGCSTRDDVLRRDLTQVELDGCRVGSGLLHDPYGGQDVAFSRQNASDVQIDHVVALADAWQKGAQTWTAARRLDFANDLLNLLAVSGTLNQAKGAGDAATWLPPARSYRCPYVIRQIAVKSRYGLRVTAAERDAMSRELGRCRTVRTPGAGA
jgi:hypothetical protein